MGLCDFSKSDSASALVASKKILVFGFLVVAINGSNSVLRRSWVSRAPRACLHDLYYVELVKKIIRMKKKNQVNPASVDCSRSSGIL